MQLFTFKSLEFKAVALIYGRIQRGLQKRKKEVHHLQGKPEECPQDRIHQGKKAAPETEVAGARRRAEQAAARKGEARETKGSLRGEEESQAPKAAEEVNHGIIYSFHSLFLLIHITPAFFQYFSFLN